MYKLVVVLLILLLASISTASAIAAKDEPYLVQASPINCKHGLHKQPKGPFSVFLFCDDAAGSNIGVILTEPGAGPGNIELSGERVWENWDTTNRFWQDSKWSADVINFLWSPSGKYLYVATDEIYGDGGLFRLDLINREVKRLIPEEAFGDKPSYEYGVCSTEIKDVDFENMTMNVLVGICSSSNNDETSDEELKQEDEQIVALPIE